MNKRLRWKVLDRYGYSCVYCGRNAKRDGVKLEIDHKIPRAKGGPTVFANLVTACFDCNRGKSDIPVSGAIAKNPVASPSEYVRTAFQQNGTSLFDAEREARSHGRRISRSMIHLILMGKVTNPGIQTLNDLAFVLRRPRLEVIEVFSKAA